MPAISGIARVDASRYLVVHDVKSASARAAGEAEQEDTPPWRCGLMTFVEGGTPRYEPLHVLEHGPIQGNDIEAVTPVPGRAGSFYLLESGSDRKHRRLFTVTVRTDGAAATATLDERVIDLQPYTKSLANVEGIVADRLEDGRVMLLLADRGDQRGNEPAVDPAVEFVGIMLDADGRVEATPGSTLRLTGSYGRGWRLCTDLCPDPDGNVWMSSSLDSGNMGPFESRVFRIGKLQDGRFVAGEPEQTNVIAGHKVEGICFTELRVAAGRGTTKPVNVLMLASDNEGFGGAVGVAGTR